MTIKTFASCPHCGDEVKVLYTPADKGRTYGPPERCWEPSAAELETVRPECQSCGEEFTEADVDRMLLEVEAEEADER